VTATRLMSWASRGVILKRKNHPAGSPALVSGTNVGAIWLRKRRKPCQSVDPLLHTAPLPKKPSSWTRMGVVGKVEEPVIVATIGVRENSGPWQSGIVTGICNLDGKRFHRWGCASG